MKIILNKRKNGKTQDSIDYIFNMSKKNFNNLLKTLNNIDEDLTFLYEYESIDTTIEFFSISGLFSELSQIPQNTLNKTQINKINQLLTCRNEKALKKQISKKYGFKKQVVKEMFEVLSGVLPFSEFIEKRTIESNKVSLRDHLTSLLSFGKPKLLPSGGTFIRDYYYDILEKISMGEYTLNFFITENQGHTKNFSLIRNRISAENYINNSEVVIETAEEPDWQINDELKNYVYADMPNGISSEEMAVWVYLKLCKTLQYDSRKYFKKTNAIDTNLLESIKPNSKIICFDFARIFSKFVNSTLPKDIESKVVGHTAHFSSIVISPNIAATFDSTNAFSSTSDLFKVKMGLPIEGVKIFFDEKNIISSSLQKFLPIISGDIKTLDSYMNMLNALHSDEENDLSENNLPERLASLLKTLKEKNATGFESIAGIIKFASLGFLGEDVEKALIVEQINNNENSLPNINILLSSKNEEAPFYLVTSENMEIVELAKPDLISRFYSKQYRYFDNNHTIKSLENDLSPLIKDKEAIVK